MLVVSNGAFKNGSTWLNRIARQILQPGSLPTYYQDPTWVNESIAPHLFDRFLDEVDFESVTYVSKNHVRDAGTRWTLLSNEHVRVLNITRDIRDVLVSAYFHDCRDGRADGDIVDYWRGFGRKRIGWVLEHHRLWNTGHSQVFVTSYEALQSSFAHQVQSLAAFLGVGPVDVDAIRSDTDFRRLRRAEATRSVPFHRKGVVGDWRNHLTDEVLDELAQFAGSIDRGGLQPSGPPGSLAGPGR